MFRENDSFEELAETRQKLAHQSFSSFEERKNELNRSKNAFLGAVGGIVLAAIVGWVVFAPKYKEIEEKDIPIVRRPQTSVKVQPADPGGMEILDQDKTVYEIIEKDNNNIEVSENLLPPPEEPKLPEVVEEKTVEINAEPIVPVVETVELPKKEEEKQEATLVVAEEPAEVVEPVKEEEILKEAPAQAYSFQDFKQVNPANPKRYVIETTESKLKNSEFDTPTPVAEVVKPKPAPVVAPTPTPAASGTWQVQLMASQNKPAVEASWKTLAKKYDVLNGQTYEVETADLGAKGIFYRLKAGAFSSKADADALCNSVKAAGGSCLVTKK